MTTSKIHQNYVEFSPGKDPFEKARQKGSRSWILKHIFYGSNKFFFLIVLITTIISSNLTAIIYVTIGNAITDFLIGNYSTLIFYTLFILLLSVGTPLMRLANFLLREVIAQRMERDCRRECSHGN